MKNKEYNNWFLFTLFPFVMAAVIRFIYLCLRVDYLGVEHPRKIWKQDDNLIIALWHELILLTGPGYRGADRAYKTDTRILISQSKDGELIARVMYFLGFGAVRGSSSRGGKGALREMVRISREPVDLVFTPDGPRGPRQVAKMGVAQLGKMSGRGVVPFSLAVSRGFRFSSWDRFLFPYPFGRAVYSFGEPLYHQPDEDLEHFLSRIETAMLENDKRAAAKLEEYGLSAV
ncbi:MAG: hypothetical protein C0623_09945 [Desulfuromonas sp.]|nr:MAG: hypothetical protein C0623_09945 [Desulfuromonas sp.]